MTDQSWRVATNARPAATSRWRVSIEEMIDLWQLKLRAILSQGTLGGYGFRNFEAGAAAGAKRVVPFSLAGHGVHGAGAQEPISSKRELHAALLFHIQGETNWGAIPNFSNGTSMS